MGPNPPRRPDVMETENTLWVLCTEVKCGDDRGCRALGKTWPTGVQVPRCHCGNARRRLDAGRQQGRWTETDWCRGGGRRPKRASAERCLPGRNRATGGNRSNKRQYTSQQVSSLLVCSSSTFFFPPLTTFTRPRTTFALLSAFRRSSIHPASALYLQYLRTYLSNFSSLSKVIPLDPPTPSNPLMCA